MTKKIHIEELPQTEAFTQRKRLIQARGELALIEELLRRINLGVDLRPTTTVEADLAAITAGV